MEKTRDDRGGLGELTTADHGGGEGTEATRWRRAPHSGFEGAELEHRAALELGSRVRQGRHELWLGIYEAEGRGAHATGRGGAA